MNMKEAENLAKQRRESKHMKRLRARWNGVYPKARCPGYNTENTNANEIKEWLRQW